MRADVWRHGGRAARRPTMRRVADPMLFEFISPEKATPTKWPLLSKTGPPELPGLMAASICRMSWRSCTPESERSLIETLEMTPRVRVTEVAPSG